MSINDNNGYLGYDGARRYLGLKRGTLYSLVCRGRIPHIRLGKRLVLFSVKELDEWLAARSVTPADEEEVAS